MLEIISGEETMKRYTEMSRAELENEFASVEKEYEKLKAMRLSLDMSRGKPGPDQLDISTELFSALPDGYISESGTDCRNYGGLYGLPEMRKLFAKILGVDESLVIVGGNSSLNLMFDAISQGMTHGYSGCEPWLMQGKVKFLCFTPGYDRHFAIAEYFGMELISVPLDGEGPDMDTVREYVKDDKVKGMFCVPKYSNPSGIIYSDRVVREIAALTPAAKDFRIIWDNAYAVHGFGDNNDCLLPIYRECEKLGHEDMLLMFTSTSKISFPGAGVSAIAASPANFKELEGRFKFQTIGPDKMNQLRHIKVFGTYDGLMAHMKRLAAVLKPRFDTVTETFRENLGGLGIAKWTEPTGGYFIDLSVPHGCAGRIARLCAEAGLKLTPAGAPFPYGNDPDDAELRIAPSYPLIPELKAASELLTVSVRFAALEKLLEK